MIYKSFFQIMMSLNVLKVRFARFSSLLMSPNVNTQRSFDCFLTQRFCFPPLSLSSQSKRFFYLSQKNQGIEEECLFLSYTLSGDTQTR